MRTTLSVRINVVWVRDRLGLQVSLSAFGASSHQISTDANALELADMIHSTLHGKPILVNKVAPKTVRVTCNGYSQSYPAPGKGAAISHESHAVYTFLDSLLETLFDDLRPLSP